MNPQDPLASLHPLREPSLIGWWPLAPGWWLVLGVILLGLLILLWFLLRRYRANAYRRQALLQLNQLHTSYLEEQDSSRYVATINALLKSVALRAYEHRAVAASSGGEWLQFLNKTVRNGEPFQADFATAAYHKACPQMDMEQVHRAARNWIRRHEVVR